MHERLQSLNEIKINSYAVTKAIYKGDFSYLFKLYDGIENEKKMLNHLNQVVPNAETTITHLNLQQEQLVDKVTDIVSKQTEHFIGDTTASRSPEGIIVLGATPGIGVLESRLDAAYQLTLKFPNIPVLLSGKGRGEQSESQYMSQYLIKKGVDTNRLILENYSLDTVGNAEFSFFEMQKNILSQNAQAWIIITSEFHALRSLYTFREIFPDNYQFAVLLAPALTEDTANSLPVTIRDMVKKEISSSSNNQFQALLTYPSYKKSQHQFETQPTAKQPCSILFEMIQKHGLYNKNAAEIAHRYPECN